MWHQLITVIFIIACACAVIQAQSDVFQSPQRRNNKYCGKVLADMLSTICHGVYNTKFHKKSVNYDDSDEDYSYDQQQYLEDSHPKFPFRTRTNAAAFIPGTFRRYTRGVYDECCKKPCTIGELVTYCAK